MNRLRKLFNNLNRNEDKLTIDVLNDDCIQEVIKKLSINEILRLEKVNKRFELCVKEVLKQQKVIRFDANDIMCCKHSAINSRIINSKTDINFEKIKAVLKKCPNIKCLQMSEILINKSLIEWICNNCKQLVCIHLYRPKSKSKSPQIEFKEIGKLLSDKIEIEINFRLLKEMGENSIIALIQNVPQIKDIEFWNKSVDHMLNPGLILRSGLNIRSFSIHCNYLTINDLNCLKTNTNLVELCFSTNCQHSQQIFDFICDNLTQLKSFCFGVYAVSISISKLIKLINLENLELSISEPHFSLMDKNNCLNQTLKSLNLRRHMTHTLFEKLVQMFPNIEKISFDFFHLKCEHQNNNENCFQCNDKVIKCLSKLNRLKVLETSHLTFQIIRVIERNINKHTFKQLEELKLCYSWCPIILDSKLLFIDLIQSLTQLCERNPQKLFNFKTKKNLLDLISEKKLINGIEYNVFFDCEKFEKNYGKKFEIPKNLRIIGY